MGSRSHVQIVIQVERFGSKHTGRKRIKSGNHILHRYKQVANIDYSILHESGTLSSNQYSENIKRMSGSALSEKDPDWVA